MRVLDTVANLAHLSGRFRKPEPPHGAVTGPGGGPLAQLETRLAGVVVAALNEAFDRDRARMELERAHLEAERHRAEEALRAELRRQAAERALGQVRLVAVMAIAVWIVSASLAIWMPGMRGASARYLLAGGWACVIGAVGCAFAGWQRIAAWSATGSPRDGSECRPGLAELIAPWLLLAAIALSGGALLLALRADSGPAIQPLGPQRTTSSAAVESLSELVPTMTSKRPGSTTRFISRPTSDNASGPSVNVTVRVSPGSSVTRSNPASSFGGRVTELTTSWIYICTTSSPRRLPVFLIVTVTVADWPDVIDDGDTAGRPTSNVV